MDKKEHPIRKLREAKKMTLEELSSELGVSLSALHKWETSWPPSILFRYRRRFELFYGFDPVEETLKLMGEDGEENE